MYFLLISFYITVVVATLSLLCLLFYFCLVSGAVPICLAV